MTRGQDPKELLQLLGPEFADEPSSAQLTAYLAGELDDEGLAREAENYLRENPRIAERLRAALDSSEALDERAESKGRAVLTIARPPLRAAAASLKDDALPVPDERRVLVDEGGLRVVYLREGERARLGLFRHGPGLSFDEVKVRLDDEIPVIITSGEDARIYDLGPARALVGHELSLEREGVSWRWLLAEDAE